MENKKLFEDAKFGDKFLTVNGKVSLFVGINDDYMSHKYYFLYNEKEGKYMVDENGVDKEWPSLNIVSKIENDVSITPEEIEEECEMVYHEGGFDIPEEVFCLNINCTYTDFRWGFEQGYQAAWKKLTGKDLVYSKDDKENK